MVLGRALGLGGLCGLLLLASAAIAHPDEPRGRLGIQLQPMTPELRTFLKAPEDRGMRELKGISGPRQVFALVEAGRA